MKLERLGTYLCEIPKSGAMKVSARAYLSEAQVAAAHSDRALEQVANAACLPGIVGHSLAMPDLHWGYGFPIGGVAAVDAEDGAISPGGVGYDINCGCRVVTTALAVDRVRPMVRELVAELYESIPTGVGSSKAIPRLSKDDVRAVMRDGALWAIERGYAAGEDDAARCEEEGALRGADPSAVSEQAIARGADQLGTLGSGNHFLELQRVDSIEDGEAAEAFGLFVGQVVVMIHSGSRGLATKCATRRFTTSRPPSAVTVRITPRFPTRSSRACRFDHRWDSVTSGR